MGITRAAQHWGWERYEQERWDAMTAEERADDLGLGSPTQINAEIAACQKIVQIMRDQGAHTAGEIDWSKVPSA